MEKQKQYKYLSKQMIDFINKPIDKNMILPPYPKSKPPKLISEIEKELIIYG